MEARVVVMPLSLLAPGDDDAYIAEGLTEGLISALTKVEGLRVVARASARSFDGRERTIAEIGRELGAGTVVDGCVRRQGDELRVNLHLIDVASSETRWSRELSVTSGDLFALQTQAAVAVVEALEPAVEANALSRLRRSPTRDPEAYELYLRGRRAYRRRDRVGNEEAVQFFLRALELDADFALARAGLANAYALRAARYSFGEAWRDRAEATAREALAREPELPRRTRRWGSSRSTAAA